MKWMMCIMLVPIFGCIWTLIISYLRKRTIDRKFEASAFRQVVVSENQVVVSETDDLIEGERDTTPPTPNTMSPKLSLATFLWWVRACAERSLGCLAG